MQQFPALLYHHVGPFYPSTNRALTVSPEAFQRQMKWLARRGYCGIRPSEWLDWNKSGVEKPLKPIFITFDDAYADLTEFALPVLARYGFGAGVFVVTGHVGRTNTWDELNGYDAFRIMTAEQIRHWSAQGIEFGAHSRSHPDLTKLSEPELKSEISGSRDDLSSLLGSPVITFAYPYGDFNHSVYSVVRKHFAMAFTVQEGMNSIESDPHLLCRAYIGPSDSLIEFAIKVRRGCGLKWLRDLRGKLKLRTRIKAAMKYFQHRLSNPTFPS
jgi:peptidoglycan/xylan/chitin deacetylase (PgdA/CDA1 family)